MTELAAATDADFAWMLGEAPGSASLTQPPGGVDDPVVLAIVRRMSADLWAAHDRGSWMMVEAGEVVGLCSYRRAPNAAGEVEIGYGVAPARRGLGHATRAVAAMIQAARADPKVRVLTASTALSNFASQKALERNGFVEIGRDTDLEDGALILWRRELEA
jgi:RimJ/RimL family protein N-acetyltransferase